MILDNQSFVPESFASSIYSNEFYSINNNNMMDSTINEPGTDMQQNKSSNMPGQREQSKLSLYAAMSHDKKYSFQTCKNEEKNNESIIRESFRPGMQFSEQKGDGGSSDKDSLGSHRGMSFLRFGTRNVNKDRQVTIFRQNSAISRKHLIINILIDLLILIVIVIQLVFIPYLRVNPQSDDQKSTGQVYLLKF